MKFKGSVLLLGHGSADNAHAAAQAHALRLAASGRYAAAEVAFLKGEPSVAAGLARLPAGPVAVVPLALAEGHVTRVLVPKMLAAAADPRRPTTCLNPAGTASVLPRIVGARAVATARQAGLDPSTAALMLIAHGGGTGASRDGAWRMAAALDGATPFHTVGTALLEESPSIAETASRLGNRLVAAGLFAERGDHVQRDIEAELDRLRSATGATILDAGPIGATPAYYEAILEILEMA